MSGMIGCTIIKKENKKGRQAKYPVHREHDGARVEGHAVDAQHGDPMLAKHLANAKKEIN
jgi:hypothetical protein